VINNIEYIYKESMTHSDFYVVSLVIELGYMMVIGVKFKVWGLSNSIWRIGGFVFASYIFCYLIGEPQSTYTCHLQGAAFIQKIFLFDIYIWEKILLLRMKDLVFGINWNKYNNLWLTILINSVIPSEDYIISI
jgi:hypothetical protein